MRSKSNVTELIPQSVWDRAFLGLATAPLPKPRKGTAQPRAMAMYSRQRSRQESPSSLDEWGTPLWLFDLLDEEFGFTLDVCATADNTMVPRNFITPEQDGLRTSWALRSRGGPVFCNPPYDHTLKDWMRKAFFESRAVTSVCLIPARTGQRFWWEFVIKSQVRFLRSTLKYTRGGVEMGQAPFPSAIAIFGPKIKPSVRWWDARTDSSQP
jgi:site-specific DNA-methyltransferase (adenine-specific)